MVLAESNLTLTESRAQGGRQAHMNQSVKERNPISPPFLVHKIGYRAVRRPER